jgi:hypothetical protein
MQEIKMDVDYKLILQLTKDISFVSEEIKDMELLIRKKTEWLKSLESESQTYKKKYAQKIGKFSIGQSVIYNWSYVCGFGEVKEYNDPGIISDISFSLENRDVVYLVSKITKTGKAHASQNYGWVSETSLSLRETDEK